MTLKDLINESVSKFGKKVFIVDKGIYRRKEYSFKEIHSRAKAVCGYFSSEGIKKGDKVIIYAMNNSDYAILLTACALSGVIAVPIDFNSSFDFVKSIANKTKAKKVFCSIYRNPNSTKRVFIESLEEVYEKYSKFEINEKIDSTDIFEIVYTSGTTSNPKGAVILNKNIVSNINSFKHHIPSYIKDYTILSILPLSHLFEQNLGFFVPFLSGSKIVYQSSRKSSSIIETLKKEKINCIVTVPLFLESIKNKIERIAEIEGKKEKLENSLKRFSKMHVYFRRALFRKIRKNFLNLEVFFVGGASLDIETERFWRNMGVEVLQGYGLTETSPLLTCNRFKDKKEGTVGKVLDGVEIKLVDGEIVAKGENIFDKYYNNKEETAKVFKNEWFYTGDIGEFDNEGYLKITGRKKNMILSSSGLNVYPEDIERVLNTHPEIKESIVLGLNNGTKLVGVVLSDKNIDLENLLKDVNSKLASHQYLSEIIKWNESDFPRTPTKKVKRNLIMEKLLLKNNGKQDNIKTISEDILIKLVSEVIDLPYSKIKENSVLSELGLDSIKRIELTVKIEEKFDIDFNEDDITEKTKISDLRNLIKNTKLNESETGLNFLNSKMFIPFRFISQLLLVGLSRTIYSINVKGKENLINEQVIYIANHSSMFDTLTVLRALPIKKRTNIYVAAAKDFFFQKGGKWGRFLGIFGRLVFNAFSFSRETQIKQSLKDFGEVINNGGDVLIFPEGTRSLDGKLLPFKPGIGLLSTNMDVKVIPIKMKGIYDILPKGKIIPKMGKVKVIIGKPIRINKLDSFDKITTKLQDELKKL